MDLFLSHSRDSHRSCPTWRASAQSFVSSTPARTGPNRDRSSATNSSSDGALVVVVVVARAVLVVARTVLVVVRSVGWSCFPLPHRRCRCRRTFEADQGREHQGGAVHGPCGATGRRLHRPHPAPPSDLDLRGPSQRRAESTNHHDHPVITCGRPSSDPVLRRGFSRAIPRDPPWLAPRPAARGAQGIPT